MVKKWNCRSQSMIFFMSLLAIMAFHTVIANDAAG